MSESSNRRFNSLTKKMSWIANMNNQCNNGSASSASLSSLAIPQGGKRALLCCISYKKQNNMELKGTAQDLKKMSELLIQQFNFPKNSILILAEDERYVPPTKKNIEAAFEWLMRDIKAQDSLVFYFSGHGLRQPSSNRQEMDGFDEAIVPVDFKTNGMILDDYINKKMVRPLIAGVTLHAIVDSCHSGTVMDLQYVYDIATGKWDDHSTAAAASMNHSTKGGKAICISACEDYQQAAETSVFSQNQNMNGAMTSALIRAIKGANGGRITYREILDSMNKSLLLLNEQDDDVGSCLLLGGAGLWRRRSSRYYNKMIFQDPMLSSSLEFDVNTEFKL